VAAARAPRDALRSSAEVSPGTRIALPSGRAYYLTLPGGDAPAPLLVGLHGHALTPANFATSSGLPAMAGSARRCVAVVAEGVDHTWNAGGSWPSAGADDVAYLDDVAVDVAQRAPVDALARYLLGFSAGAMMCWRAVAESATWNAAGIVSGALLVPGPSRPVDVLHIHGTGDTTVPVAGGLGVGGVVFPPAYREPWSLPRASVWSLLPTAYGHGWPGWATPVLYDFFTRDRFIPQ
jgi:poly(3-hydroxybutyrate) depolymerase